MMPDHGVCMIVICPNSLTRGKEGGGGIPRYVRQQRQDTRNSSKSWGICVCLHVWGVAYDMLDNNDPIHERVQYFRGGGRWGEMAGVVYDMLDNNDTIYEIVKYLWEEEEEGGAILVTFDNDDATGTRHTAVQYSISI